MSTQRSVTSSIVAQEFVPSVDQLIERNKRFASGTDDSELNAAPEMRLVVVACMDARMNIAEILGLKTGDAHILRNAGGVVTDDVIRSICLSQRLLGTREIILLHHTDCGMQRVDEGDFIAELRTECGVEPNWAIEGFEDPYLDTQRSMQRLVDNPFVDASDTYGFVYDVDSGLLHQVEKGI